MVRSGLGDSRGSRFSWSPRSRRRRPELEGTSIATARTPPVTSIRPRSRWPIPPGLDRLPARKSLVFCRPIQAGYPFPPAVMANQPGADVGWLRVHPEYGLLGGRPTSTTPEASGTSAAQIGTLARRHRRPGGPTIPLGGPPRSPRVLPGRALTALVLRGAGSVGQSSLAITLVFKGPGMEKRLTLCVPLNKTGSSALFPSSISSLMIFLVLIARRGPKTWRFSI